MASSELVSKTARELATLIKSRQISPVELTTAYLARIEALNPKLNAFITVTADFALKQAHAAEKQIAAGTYLGPLHGIPYAPKDNLATKGIRTTNGSKVTPDWVPAYESTITARLNRAGAILIGKLNLLEFAVGSGVLSGFGPARNPWNLEHSPSGSSSGSGAALIADMVPLSIGTDTGGSMRSPASHCGIVSLKQTYGRVSRYGVTTLSWTLDHAGPMTRSVRDAAAMLQVIAGADPEDPTAARRPVGDYSQGLTRDLKGLRVGVPTNYFFDVATPETLKAVRTAIGVLKELGATLVDVEVPHAKHAPPSNWIIMTAEAACFHEKRLRETPELFDPLVRERIEIAKFFTATDYIKALRVRTLVMEDMRRVFEKCDVMAVPNALWVAPRLETPDTAGTDVKPASAGGTRGIGNTNIGNMTGMPALAVPCGFSSGSPMLPVGLQLYARPFNESALIRVGHAYESATEWHKRRPALDAASTRPA